MKVLLYFEKQELIKKSGIGRAFYHQKMALELAGLDYTLDPKDSFDIAHINTFYRKSGKLARKLKKQNVPVIVHGHSTKEDFKKSFRFWQIMQFSVNHQLKRIYSCPDLIITPTNYSKSLIENYKFVSCPVKAISNGIDLKGYAIPPLSREEIIDIKAQFGMEPDQKFIMGIGWYFERKGIHDFIEVARAFPNIKFIWFGQRMRGLIPHKINKAVRKKPKNVILPGYIQSDVIKKMLHLTDCFFFPSYEETEGIVVLEALAAKAPLLIRDINVFDYLTHQKDCIKANNNRGFIDAINYILSNDMGEITSNAYELVKERDIHVVSKELKQTYEELLNK